MKIQINKVLLLILFCASISLAQKNSIVTEIINKVSSDSLFESLKELTGEKSVALSQGSVFITSRYYLRHENFYAEEYLLNRLKKYIPSAYMQIFSGGGGNIIAVKKGIKKPNQHIIICAHFDNMPGNSAAPGADDNGSGTVAVIEAARILSKYSTDYTIVFALWDNEESGLNGSYYYAQQAYQKKDSITAVINMDMIGWDENNDSLAELHVDNSIATSKMSSIIFDTNTKYNLALNLSIINPGAKNSDQASFWNFNYPAVLIIENATTIDQIRDFNKYYHTVNDRIEYLNKSYFNKLTKLAIGALAEASIVSIPTNIKDELPSQFILSQNYPNPFNPETIINYQIKEAGYVSLKVYDIIGREVAILVDEYKQAGVYNSQFSIHNSKLTSGVYYYTLRAGNYNATKKMLLVK